MILLWKGTSAPVVPLLKGQRWQWPCHASILQRLCAYHSTHTLFTRCRRLQATVCQGNTHKLYQRSPETEQFITAKISGNALKQGSRTHPVLRRRNSQLKKTQGCANVSSISSRPGCMQRGWRTPRVDSLKFVNYAIMVNGLLFHMTQPTSRGIIKAIAYSKPMVSEQ